MTVNRNGVDQGAVSKRTVTAKGNLIVGTANSVVSNLAVGNDGETLVADSSATTGLRYQAPVNVNPFLNSAFQVWQRGTSFASGSPQYTADRWQLARGSNVSGATITRQTTSDTTNLPNIQYCMRVSRDNGNTSTNPIYMAQSFETINSIPYAGKTITYSFYARKGANYSATSSGLTVFLAQGTGTDQNLLTAGYTGGTNIINQTVTLTTTWQRFTFTASVPSTATEIGTILQFDPTGTAGAADYYEVTGVQLEVGSVATPFKTYGGTIQGELAACKYYYDKRGGQAGTGTILNNALSNSAGTNAAFNFPITMRVAPTAVEYASLRLSDTSSGFTVSSVTLTNCTSTTANVNVATTGMTGFRSCYLDSSATGNYIAFSAEL